MKDIFFEIIEVMWVTIIAIVIYAFMRDIAFSPISNEITIVVKIVAGIGGLLTLCVPLMVIRNKIKSHYSNNFKK